MELSKISADTQVNITPQELHASICSERGLELPPPQTKRWVVSKKAIILDAVRADKLTQDEIEIIYDVSQEEFYEWYSRYERSARKGLRVTRRKPL